MTHDIDFCLCSQLCIPQVVATSDISHHTIKSFKFHSYFCLFNTMFRDRSNSKRIFKIKRHVRQETYRNCNFILTSLQIILCY